MSQDIYKSDIGVSTTSNFNNLVHCVARSSLTPDETPEEITLNGYEEVSPIPEGREWVTFLEPQLPSDDFTVEWSGFRIFVVKPRCGLVKLLLDGVRVPMEVLTRTVQGWPFELLSTTPMHELEGEILKRFYKVQKGFADMHHPHGWVCAFKGAGHDRLVSRRWLEHGPWRLLRYEPEDISVVQFHDLEVDPMTAMDQATDGYDRMGISDKGGFIQTDFVWEYEDWRGIYVPEQRKFEIVITARDVSELEMLEARALIHYQKLGEEKPLERIAYVFLERKRAEAHLHELWLRELECWTYTDAGELVRLDDRYEPPPPQKPAWIAEVEARDAERGVTYFDEVSDG